MSIFALNKQSKQVIMGKKLYLQPITKILNDSKLMRSLYR